ncbi:MAG: peptide chain release factor N(5)-glutamine methyltransferase [Spirochaetes bacterium]|jgi:release factor glutamine methyltransferase|nr:peptide chain release factor N(5)-glutamine methyltransferase [Spirochaetota bacterium]
MMSSKSSKPPSADRGCAPKTVGEAVKEISARLVSAGVETPVLDAEVLLAFALGVERYRLLVDAGRPVDPAGFRASLRMTRRRCAGEPVAYIVGRKEFYSLDFRVTRGVLIPRPETELLVDMALYHARPGAVLLDLGTGSGAIAVAVARNRPDIKVYASDISSAALRVAKWNCRHLAGPRAVTFRAGDLFAPFEGKRFDVVVSNPPYIDPSVAPSLQREIAFEPEVALFAGERGRAVLSRIIASAGRHLTKDGVLLLEMGHDMRDFIMEAGRKGGYTVSVFNDLSGLPRAALLKR